MPLRSQQWQTALNMEHVREHLIRVGLMNTHGRILSKKEYEQQQRIRRQSPSENEYRDRIGRRPASDIGYRKSLIESKKNDEQHRRSKTPSSRSRSPSPSRLSRRASAITRRLSPPAVSRPKTAHEQPKFVPIHERCLVTMIYHGPQSLLDSKRSVVERTTDEIIVMQQHCGGENLLVFRQRLNPHDTFEFRSRRHPDYPFALTFYVNGLVDHRLSICCEWRYRSNVRLGGKRALFSIVRVEQAKPCQRCRLERRTMRLAERRMKKLLLSAPTPDFESLSASSDRYNDQSSEFQSRRARKNSIHREYQNLDQIHDRLLSVPRQRATLHNLSRQSITSIDSLDMRKIH